MIDGTKVRKLRLARGMTQMDLAVAVGTYPTEISHMENAKIDPRVGRPRDYRLSFAQRVAKALGVELAKILADE